MLGDDLALEIVQGAFVVGHGGDGIAPPGRLLLPMKRNVALLLALSLAWAAGYLFVSAAEAGAPPITDTVLMVALAAAVMLPGVAWGLRRPLLPTLRARPWVPVVMGLSAVALPNLAIVLAERTVEASEAAVLGTTVPVLTLLLTVFVTRETRLTWQRALGVAVAVAGILVFVGWANLTDGGAQLDGVLTMLGGGVVFAVNGLFVARVAKDLDAAALGAWTMLFALPWLAGAAWLFEGGDAISFTERSFAAVAAEGILSLGLAYLVYYVLVGRAGAWFASLYAFLVPPLGLVLTAIVDGEVPAVHHLVGMGVVLAGLWLLSRKGRPGTTRGRAAGESRADGPTPAGIQRPGGSRPPRPGGRS
jgi:drug/metabolite transporter (DMT)-like permease